MKRLTNESDFSLADHEDRLVWIFGSSRSGSTWLLRMLSELDGTVPIDDPHVGHHLGVWRPIPLAWAIAEGEQELITLNEVKRDKPSYFFSERYREAWMPALRELIRTRFDAQAADVLSGRSMGKTPLVIVKEPGSHVADLLLELFPSSRMIFLLRDGRDVVHSWVAAHRPGTWAVREGAFAAQPEKREVLVRWLATVWTYRTETVQRAYGAHDPDRRVLVRYEDLLEDSVRQLERMCGPLGVAADRTELERIAARNDYAAVPSSDKGDDKPIRSATPGGWRRMTPSERRAMHEVMGRKLIELGYVSRVEEKAA
jgi:hypothetical protein